MCLKWYIIYIIQVYTILYRDCIWIESRIKGDQNLENWFKIDPIPYDPSNGHLTSHTKKEYLKTNKTRRSCWTTSEEIYYFLRNVYSNCSKFSFPDEIFRFSWKWSIFRIEKIRNFREFLTIFSNFGSKLWVSSKWKVLSQSEWTMQIHRGSPWKLDIKFSPPPSTIRCGSKKSLLKLNFIWFN